MQIGSKIILVSSNPELPNRIFYMFDDGCVRDMSFGVGKVINYHAFDILYHALINMGYVEV